MDLVERVAAVTIVFILLLFVAAVADEYRKP